MKKFILFLFFMPFAIVGKAQTLPESDLAKIAIEPYDSGFDGEDYTKAASVIAKDYPPDKDGVLTRIFIVENINKTKDQIYVAINNWFISHDRPKRVIQLNDREAGAIIGECIVPYVEVSDVKGVHTDAIILVRIDIKENRVRIITQIKKYEKVFPPMGGYPESRVEQNPVNLNPFRTKVSNAKEGLGALCNSHVFCLKIISGLRDAVIANATVPIEATDNW